MSHKKKIFWGGLILGAIILLAFLANLYVKNRLQQELDKQGASSVYEDLSVNIFLNNFSIKNVEIKEQGFGLTANKIRAKGLSYYKYIFNNKLEIDEVELTSPEVKLFPKDSSTKSNSGKNRDVLINKISINDGSLSKISSASASPTFFAHMPKAVVKNVSSGMKISDLKSYQLRLDTLYLKMNSEHFIDVGELSAQDGHVEISDFEIKSFYPKIEFDQKIPYEKDRISLVVKNISLDSLNIDKRNDTLFLQNSEMTVSNALLNVYRNKLVADDPREKPLYSNLLREAPILINFQKVFVENSEILYEEQAKAEDGPAMVRFAGVNAEINNLHNLRELSSQPKITANADFMRGTPVTMEWTFPVFDLQDKFTISGSFGSLEGEALDPFLVPSLNARARGTLNSVYFNFYGNDDFLRGDFKMDYNKFKVELLSKNEKKKGFLSSLANLLIDNKKEPDEESGNQVKVDRNKNRSFWNYVWKGLREGLVDAVGQL